MSVASDLQTVQSNIDSVRQTMVTKLSSKGVTASSGLTMTQLANKIDDIVTGGTSGDLDYKIVQNIWEAGEVEGRLAFLTGSTWISYWDGSGVRYTMGDGSTVVIDETVITEDMAHNYNGVNYNYDNSPVRIDIGSGVTELQGLTFCTMNNLEEVYICNNTLTSFPTYCFIYSQKIKNVYINSTSLTSLGAQAFAIEEWTYAAPIAFDFRQCSNAINITASNHPCEYRRDVSLIVNSLPYEGTGWSDSVSWMGYHIYFYTINQYALQNANIKRYYHQEWSELNDYFGKYLSGNLPTINIPNDVYDIQSYIFYHNTNIKKITLPGNLMTIGDFAFNSCSSLVSINMPENLTSIGPNAFLGCTSLPLYNGVRYADTLLAFANAMTQTTYEIKSGTKYIGGKAFYNCKSMTGITIPTSVKYIGPNSFENCIKLTSIEIPNSVTKIDDNAFKGCTVLTSATIGRGVSEIPNGCFTKCGLTDITIPSTVNFIQPNAFSSCVNLTSVTIPESVVSLGNNAFDKCSGLTSVTLRGVMSEIPYACFSLTSISSITIPTSVSIIGNYAFSQCSYLSDVTIPDSVFSIDTESFRLIASSGTLHCSEEWYNQMKGRLGVMATDAWTKDFT